MSTLFLDEKSTSSNLWDVLFCINSYFYFHNTDFDWPCLGLVEKEGI